MNKMQLGEQPWSAELVTGPLPQRWVDDSCVQGILHAAYARGEHQCTFAVTAMTSFVVAVDAGNCLFNRAAQQLVVCSALWHVAPEHQFQCAPAYFGAILKVLQVDNHLTKSMPPW